MENAGGETRSHTQQAWATSQGFTAAFPYGMLSFSSLLKESSSWPTTKVSYPHMITKAPK